MRLCGLSTNRATAPVEEVPSRVFLPFACMGVVSTARRSSDKKQTNPETLTQDAKQEVLLRCVRESRSRENLFQSSVWLGTQLGKSSDSFASRQLRTDANFDEMRTVKRVLAGHLFWITEQGLKVGTVF